MNELPAFRECGIAAIRLLQGVIYQEDEETWTILLSSESDLADYFSQIGLTLVVDRAEGLAYLKQLDDDERSGGYERLPRLFRRTPLGYEATIACVLLRDEYRKFEEEDLDNEFCAVEFEPLFDLWKSFVRADSDEVTLRRRLLSILNQLEKLKFVRNVSSDNEVWEVRRLLKVRIPIEQLEILRSRLAGDDNL